MPNTLLYTLKVKMKVCDFARADCYTSSYIIYVYPIYSALGLMGN